MDRTRKPCQMDTHVWYDGADLTLHAETVQSNSQDTGTFVSQKWSSTVHLYLGFKKYNKFRAKFNSGSSYANLDKDWDLSSGGEGNWIFWSLKIENANSNQADVTLYSSATGSVAGSVATTYASSPPMYKSETMRHNKYQGRGAFWFGPSAGSKCTGYNCGCSWTWNGWSNQCTGTTSSGPGTFTSDIEMDDFYLFNDRALSSAEIYAIRTGGTVSHANLVMLFRFHFQEAWPMNGYGQNDRQLSPSTLTVTDLSGEDRHGTATGWYIKVRT